MLKRFEVNGYRNFNETFVLDFSDVRDYQFNKQCVRDKLLNNIIIYGKNAVGKTNFGKAIFDIRSNFSRQSSAIDQESDNFLNADSKKGYANFKYVFQFDKNEVVYEYSKTSRVKFLNEKFIINGEIIFEYNHEKKEKTIGKLELINAQTLNWRFTDDDISIISYIINNVQLGNSEILEKFYRFIMGMNIARNFNMVEHKVIITQTISEIIKNKWVEDFQKFLHDFGVDVKLIAKDMPTGEKMLFFDHLRPIPFFENCSSGTLSLIRLYNWKKKMNLSTFLYMDEFDAFYHFELSEQVIKLLGETKNCQTIVTSHNTNLLSNNIMRPDCFFILSHDKLTSIVNATDRELREGHNLEKLYKSGEFGY
jgi:AAA15 family ATPase/GTPase